MIKVFLQSLSPLVARGEREKDRAKPDFRAPFQDDFTKSLVRLGVFC